MFPTVIGVVLLTFMLFNIVPNDLAVIALGKNVSPQLLESFDEQRGLNRPLFLDGRLHRVPTVIMILKKVPVDGDRMISYTIAKALM